MFERLNKTASVGQRPILIAVAFSIPIGLLAYLFVAQVRTDISFAQKERDGTARIAQIWPSFAAAAGIGSGSFPTDATADAAFGSAAAKAYADANGLARLDAGAKLIGAIADGSNLTLDPDLDSFYAMDNATVELPKLMAAIVATAATHDAKDQAVNLKQADIFADAANASLASTMRYNKSGEAEAALKTHVSALATAVQAFHGRTVLATQADAAARGDLWEEF